MQDIAERAQNAAWLKTEINEAGTNPFVLIPAGHPYSRKALFEIVKPRLPVGSDGVAFLVTTIEAIDDVGIILKPERREDFLTGTPVFIAPVQVPVLQERSQGRQIISQFETEARDGLYVNVALGVERLRACDEGRDRQHRSVEQRRMEIFERVATLVALDRFVEHPDPTERAFNFVQNSFRTGQALLSQWFQGQRARDIMKAAYSDTLEAGQGNPDVFEAIEHAQFVRLETLSLLHRRAQRYNQAQHALSESHRQGHRISRADEQVLTNGFAGGPDIALLMDAAIHGNMNPAPVVLNWGSFSTELAVGRALGQLERGQRVRFEPMHLVRFERMMEQANQWSDDDDVEVAAYRLVQDAALRIYDADFWQARFDQSKASGKEIDVSPPRNLCS